MLLKIHPNSYITTWDYETSGTGSAKINKFTDKHNNMLSVVKNDFYQL